MIKTKRRVRSRGNKNRVRTGGNKNRVRTRGNKKRAAEKAAAALEPQKENQKSLQKKS